MNQKRQDHVVGMDGQDRIDLPVIELRGGPREMGRQFGEATRAEVRQLYERRLGAAVRFARDYGREVSRGQVLATAERCLPVTERYDSAGYEEFLGIAEGAGMTSAELFVTQGLTDLRDVLAFHGPADAEGCSAVIVSRARSRDGRLLLGQNWDLQTDNMPFVRFVHRRPDDGSPETWSLTLTGCLTLIGMNSEGIAVGNTNLRTTDARIGLQYLSVLHRAVRSRSFDEAVASVREAPRSAAHYYYLGDAKGRAVGLECSAERCVAFEPGDGVLVRCNHALAEEIAAIEAPITTGSTVCRQGRLSELVEANGPISVSDLKRMFSDHEGGDQALCRHERSPAGISTNACVIMSPETGEIHACRGQPHLGEWRTGRFGEAGEG